MTTLFTTCVTLLLCLCAVRTEAGAAPKPKSLIQKVVTWKQLEFGFPTEELKQQAIANGNLVPANAVPIEVQPSYSKKALRIFTTIPRFADGIPYTLATVTEQMLPNGPALQAYPNFEMHNTGKAQSDCDKITSAFRVFINECNEMVVIDSGVVGMTQICPPQLLFFDLKTDTLKQRYRFPANLYTAGVSLFITPLSVVDDVPPQGTCSQMKVYICDVNFYGIVVYDRSTNTAWRTSNRFMFPNPDYGTHVIAGESFTLMDGIFSLVTDKKLMYFHPLASANEFSVPLSALNNKTAWDSNPLAHDKDFVKLGKRNSECASSDIDSAGFIYCVTLNPIHLLAWNTKSPYSMKEILKVPANANDLQFVSGVKILKKPSGSEELWMMSNRFQKIASGTVDWKADNFQIMKRSLSDIHSNYNSNNLNQDLYNKLIFA